MKIAILGAGALAIALTKIIDNENHDIILWTKFEREKEDIEHSRENTKLFPGVKISDDIRITNNLSEAVVGAELIINVLPFIAVRDVIEILKPIYDGNQIILSATKGIDEENFVSSTKLFEQGLGTKKIAALSGPSFAIEIANRENISFMLGSKNEESINVILDVIDAENIKIEVTDDIEGIQLAGGIKNAIAVGSGILDGLKAADSTRAAYIAMGMSDMAKIIASLGGKKETAYTYAGIGDLLLTCMSSTSRNFTFGAYVGQGFSVEQAFARMDGKTVEGYKVIRTLHKFAKENNVKLHTINTLYNIIFENGDKKQIKKI
ncbi:MAG: NAD(P)H-dependent glycerol-3-phosphate dehydrogenase [Clostridia bacterium]|nr:NAD(P)H-dependent glycerol-3-phosphate dehydrogenase [Clostridia bacterium]